MLVDEQTVVVLGSLADLNIPPEYAAGVAENLARLLAQAKLVMELELPADMEPAPVFHA
jgi:Protein of unknown function (DUF4089)